jgi:hypothetical protein
MTMTMVKMDERGRWWNMMVVVMVWMVYLESAVWWRG